MAANKIRNFSLRAFKWVKRRLKPTKNLWSSKRRNKDIMDRYEKRMGYRFDIENPVLFTEKVQWYKSFYRKKGLEKIVDKYLFKGYIKEKLGEGYTIPVYGAWTSIAALKKAWASLPEEFCLKSNVQSEGNCIKIIHNKSEIDFNELKKELKEWLKPRNTLINSHCGAYRKARTRILAEKYVSNFEDQLYDWKFFCFDGEPYCVYVATNHFGSVDYPITFYDTQWNRLNVKYGNHQTDEVACPKHFKEMLEIAKKLSKGFPFVRVDFFETDEQLFVAELTFYPGGGVTPYYPESFNRELGDKFILPQK